MPLYISVCGECGFTFCYIFVTYKKKQQQKNTIVKLLIIFFFGQNKTHYIISAMLPVSSLKQEVGEGLGCYILTTYGMLKEYSTKLLCIFRFRHLKQNFSVISDFGKSRDGFCGVWFSIVSIHFWRATGGSVCSATVSLIPRPV